MITKCGLKNFKSIREAELELAPLTVITGVNSSGKSSLLHSMAMLAQSVRGKGNKQIRLTGDLVDLVSFDRIYCKKASAIMPDQNPNIGIKFSLSDGENETKKQIDFELEYGYFGEETEPKINSSYMAYKDGKIDEDGVYIKFTRYSGSGGNILDAVSANEMKLRTPSYFNDTGINFEKPEEVLHDSNFIPCKLKYPFEFRDEFIGRAVDLFIEIITDMPSERLYGGNQYANYALNLVYGFENHTLEKWRRFDDLATVKFMNIFNMGIIFFNSMPDLDKYIAEILTDCEIYNLNDDDDPNYVDDPRGLAQWYEDVSKLDDEARDDIFRRIKEEGFKDALKVVFSSSFGSVDSAFPKIDKFIYLPFKLDEARGKFLFSYFSFNMKYLGPLREEPKELYENVFAPMDGNKKDGYKLDKVRFKILRSGVGVRGEDTVALINLWHEEDYRVNSCYPPPDSDSKEQIKNDFRLIDILIKWMGHIIFTDDITIKKNADKPTMIDLKIITDGENFFLTQLGTGVSQVLPVLVACLTADPGSTILIQNPEEQLHPKAQARLADFFIDMARSGRQCIIETHSEYFIEQLRYRIVESPVEKPLHDIVKLYFVTKRDGVSYFAVIRINEYAKLSEWPEDFFDESRKNLTKIMDKVIKKLETGKLND